MLVFDEKEFGLKIKTYVTRNCIKPPGQRFCQKIEWLRWPPPLNLRAPCSLRRNFDKKLGAGASKSKRPDRNIPNDRRNVVLRHGIRQLLLDHVEVIHVGLVVLAVVDLHNLGGDHLEIDIDRKVAL